MFGSLDLFDAVSQFAPKPSYAGRKPSDLVGVASTEKLVRSRLVAS